MKQSTLLSQITSGGHGHRELLSEAAVLAEAGIPRPLLSRLRFSTENIGADYALVGAGSVGKVVVKLQGSDCELPVQVLVSRRSYLR